MVKQGRGVFDDRGSSRSTASFEPFAVFPIGSWPKFCVGKIAAELFSIRSNERRIEVWTRRVDAIRADLQRRKLPACVIDLAVAEYTADVRTKLRYLKDE